MLTRSVQPLLSFFTVFGIAALLSAPFTWMLSPSWSVFLTLKIGLGVLSCILLVARHIREPQKTHNSNQRVFHWFHKGVLISVCALVAGLNILAFQNPYTWDVTREKIHTLSPYTTAVLKALPYPITLYAFYSPSDEPYSTAQKLFDQYARENTSHITTMLLDPDTHPDMVERFNITERGPRLVVANEHESLKINDLNEASLTQNIRQLLHKQKKEVYFLQEHSNTQLLDPTDQSPYRSFLNTLKAEGISVEPFSFQQANKGSSAALPITIPNHIRVLAWVDPKEPVEAYEKSALVDFIKRGGHLWVSLSAHTQASFLGFLRLQTNADILTDNNPVSKIVGLSENTITLTNGPYPHSILEPVTQPVVFHNTVSIHTIPPTPSSQGVRVYPLLRAASTVRSSNPKTTEQTLWAAHAVEWSVPKNTPQSVSPTAKAVVLGSSDFLQDRYFRLQSTTDFTMQSFEWLLSPEDNVVFTPRIRTSASLLLTEKTLTTLNIVTMDALPLAIASIGIYVFLRRNRKI